MTSYYDTLGVKPDASPDEIVMAYRKACRQLHPDRSGGNSDKMAAVNRAYQCLRDPETRQAYDATGHDPADQPGKADAAQSLLHDLFAGAISRVDGDPVSWITEQIHQMRTNAAARSRGLRQGIEHLKRQRDRVVTQDGAPNLYQAIIDQRIAAEQAEVEKMAGAMELAELALVQLQSYSYVPPEPSAHSASSNPFESFERSPFAAAWAGIR